MWSVRSISRGLAQCGGEGVEEVLKRLQHQVLTEDTLTIPEPARKPACRHLPQTVAETALLDSDLAAALAALDEHLNWRQTAAYSDALLGAGFMENYAHCEIIGPNGFFQGDDFLLGLILLGPHRHYKDHYHPAPELYWPLTGPSDWKRGAGGFVLRQAGETIWHRPFIVHATATQETPLLAVWCWTSDTATSAKLVGT